MQDRIKVNEEITVGAQPSEAELKLMADSGVQSVINLRQEDEKMQRLGPEEEGRIVGELGMAYVHVPVSMKEADEALVDHFRQELARAPKPVFVHCRLGKRAGALTMIDRGTRQGQSGEEVIRQAEEKGFECEEEALADFVRGYVDTH